VWSKNSFYVYLCVWSHPVYNLAYNLLANQNRIIVIVSLEKSTNSQASMQLFSLFYTVFAIKMQYSSFINYTVLAVKPMPARATCIFARILPQPEVTKHFITYHKFINKFKYLNLASSVLFRSHTDALYALTNYTLHKIPSFNGDSHAHKRNVSNVRNCIRCWCWQPSQARTKRTLNHQYS